LTGPLRRVVGNVEDIIIIIIIRLGWWAGTNMRGAVYMYIPYRTGERKKRIRTLSPALFGSGSLDPSQVARPVRGNEVLFGG
jgi:hypothetical protein